jgi:hypothetical protein
MTFFLDEQNSPMFQQVIRDSHDEISARVCSILSQSGYMEADMVRNDKFPVSHHFLLADAIPTNKGIFLSFFLSS